MEVYIHGTEVLLTATPGYGYAFAGWTGDLVSQLDDEYVVMDGNKTIIANFVPRDDHYILTIHRNDIHGGTVSREPYLPSYEDGTAVTVTAAAGVGYRFTGWSGAATGTANPVTITMDEHKDLTAHFQIERYTLTINQNPAGSGNVTPASGLSHDSGAVINISATANSGYRFINWTVVNGTATFGNANGTATTVILSSNATVAANFYLTITDSRDGKVYRIVTIGTQTWMAENLNYDVPGDTTDVCYNKRV